MTNKTAQTEQNVAIATTEAPQKICTLPGAKCENTEIAVHASGRQLNSDGLPVMEIVESPTDKMNSKGTYAQLVAQRLLLIYPERAAILRSQLTNLSEALLAKANIVMAGGRNINQAMRDSTCKKEFDGLLEFAADMMIESTVARRNDLWHDVIVTLAPLTILPALMIHIRKIRSTKLGGSRMHNVLRAFIEHDDNINYQDPQSWTKHEWVRVSNDNRIQLDVNQIMLESKYLREETDYLYAQKNGKPFKFHFSTEEQMKERLARRQVRLERLEAEKIARNTKPANKDNKVAFVARSPERAQTQLGQALVDAGFTPSK